MIEVLTPSRLHFGLFSFGGDGPQFGGCGMAINSPSLQLRCQAAESFCTKGEFGDRVKNFAHRWVQFQNVQLRSIESQKEVDSDKLELPAVELEVVSAPPEHSGFGLGTQLGLAVATALFSQAKPHDATPAMPAATEFAAATGRGLRSAVGVYAFLSGGFIVERGKQAGELLSPLDCRLDVPPQWRFLLIRPPGCDGLAGEKERNAFRDLPPTPTADRERLVSIARNELVPALAAREFNAFASSLTVYGHQAGLAFKSIQGGPYNGAKLNELAATLQELNAPGFAQSSWGPTMVVPFETEAEAANFQKRLAADKRCQGYYFHITSANNNGAVVTRI